MNVVIERNYYLDKLKRKMHNGRIKVITGMRRCGKSYLLFNLFKDYLIGCGVKDEEIVSINLEDDNNRKFRDPIKLGEYIASAIDPSRKTYVFIDEIQVCKRVPNPDVYGDEITFTDVLLTLVKNRGVDVYVTGSSSKMLSRDIPTQFRDRGDVVHVSPLSFSELRPYYENVDEAWREYMRFGGMPYLFQEEDSIEKASYLQGLFNETYIKDIIERNNVRNDETKIEILLDFIASSIGSFINPEKIANRFLSETKQKINGATVSKYLKYLEDSFILSAVKRFDIKGGKYFSSPQKYYFTDIGLRNTRLNFRQTDEGYVTENILYNDLIRRGYNVDVGTVVYSHKRGDKLVRDQLEVDFVVNNGSERVYIQVAYTLHTPQKVLQETNSLKRIDDSFKKIVLTMDKIIPSYDINGIYYMNIIDFLLSDNPLRF